MNQEYLKGIHSEMCSREAIIFQATENNIISFLKNSLFAERSEIRTLDGKRFLTTIKGKWIDICPDRIYLEEKLKPLILAVKEGRKMLLPLKQIKVEQLEGYRPPIPDWNYFFWLGAVMKNTRTSESSRNQKQLCMRLSERNFQYS